jgi:hypothetical protein
LAMAIFLIDGSSKAFKPRIQVKLGIVRHPHNDFPDAY